MKNNKGMGHITLIICIVIIIAIAVFAINFVMNESEDRGIENLITDMLLVQGKIKVIALENGRNSEENPLVGKKVQENLEDEKIKKLIEENVISQEDENFENYYIISSEELEQLNLENNLLDEHYIVDYKNYEIIYTKGMEIEGEIHYKLSDLIEHRERQEQENENTNETEIEEIEDTNDTEIEDVNA